MCEFNEYEVVENHDYANYTCPACGEEMCWSCNQKDRRGSWHGESRCWKCDEEIVAGNFA